MEFSLPARSANGGEMPLNEPATPPSTASDAVPSSDQSKPRNPRARPKTTSELLAAHDENQAQCAVIMAQLRDRKSVLESECYTALGAAVFFLRDAEQVADTYQSIVAPLGARTQKKLDELATLLHIDG